MTTNGLWLRRGAVTLASGSFVVIAGANTESDMCKAVMAHLNQIPAEHRASSLAKACGIPIVPNDDQLRTERMRSLQDLVRHDFHPLVATPIAYRAGARPILVERIELGDGWGCARLHDHATYCWQVPEVGTKPGPIKAVHIPWLDDQWIGFGPDRICTRELRNEFRCWRAPEFMSFPRTWSKPSSQVLDPKLSWEVLQPVNRTQMRDLQPVAHGPWHGCSASWCWGSEKPDLEAKFCRAGDTVVPCSLVRKDVLQAFDDRPNIGDSIVGDLFACRRWNDQLECLGANRDGWFGTAAECPPELLTSWPTAAGPLQAPHAKCAREPVRVGTGSFSGNNASASPRGVCIAKEGDSPSVSIECFGAIKPVEPGLTSIVLAPSDEPSACAVTKAGGVRCWKHGYTGAAGGKASVPIEFDIPRSGTILAWQGKGRFHADCLIDRNCTKATQVLPICDAKQGPLELSDVFMRAEALNGTRIVVTGALGISDVISDQVGMECGPYEADGMTPDESRGGGHGSDYCCQEAQGPVVLATRNGYLPLEGVLCSGDRSRMCCNVPARGQKVLVTGTLVWRDYVQSLGPSWALAQPEICEVRR